jgi:hypothetical protein
MDDRQTFKAACLLYGLSQGWSLDELATKTAESADVLRGELKKQALIPPVIKAIGGKLLDTGFGLGSTLAGGALLLGPPAIGAAVGYNAAKLTDVDDTDIEEVKTQEMLTELETLTDKIRRNNAIEAYRQQRRQELSRA